MAMHDHRYWKLESQQKVRHLELLHATHCLVRARDTIKDEFAIVIDKFLEELADLVEQSLNEKPGHDNVIKKDQ